MRKRIQTALYIALLVALLAGCSGTSTTTPAPTAAAATSATTGDTTTPAPAAEESNFNPTGLPIVKEQVTIDVLHVRYQVAGDTFKDSEYFKKMEQDTHVKIDWKVAWESDWPEQRSIMFASGDLPSVIFGARGFTDMEILSNLDYFLPLNDLIDQYMPNLQKVFEEEPAMRQICTGLDGNIYTLPKRMLARPTVSYQPFINHEWLANVGLDIPQTTEELYTVLKAFKEQDANGNGDPNDEIPVTGWASSTFMAEWQTLTLFGAYANGDGLAVRDGVVTFVPITDEFKEGVKFQHRLYSEGLLDNEFFTHDETIAIAKMGNPDTCIVGYGYAWTPDSYFGPHAAQFTTIAPPARPDGKRFSTYMASNMGRNELEITTYCEYPEVVARWADEFYTIDASVQNTWGPFDVCIEKTSDGIYKMIPPAEGESLDGRSWAQSVRDYGPKWAPATFDKFELDKEKGDGFKLEIDKIGRDYANPTFPTVTYSVAQIEEIATLATDIRAYVGTSCAKWITQGGVEEDWDAYIEQLNAMGLERLTEIRISAYEAYMK